MRKPEYLSPSALKTFEDKPDEYFIRYLADTRTPRMPQTQPMAAGSACDAMIKSHLHGVLFGKNHKDAAKYEKKALFEAEVESQNRDWAWPVGEFLFECYQESGALADLMIELQDSIDEPRFEFDLKGEIKGTRECAYKNISGVVLMGKPDLRFINSKGAHVILDWKVNGYCGNSNTSPKPGYVMLRDKSEGFWMRKGMHKNAFVQPVHGMAINTACNLETIDPDWALQLSTYGWLLGEAVGAEIITGIEQFSCNGAKKDLMGRPAIRIASHRLRVSEEFQHAAFDKYAYLWSILQDINTDRFYFFRDLSFEESKLKCETLQAQCLAIMDPETPSDVRWALTGGQ